MIPKLIQSALALLIFVPTLWGGEATADSTPSDAVSRWTKVEQYWMTTLNLFHPRGTYDQKHSNIDVLALSVAKGWHFGNGAEVHLEGIFLQANGEPYDSYWGWENRSRENWTGGALGFVLRMNYIDDERARAFVDVYVSYLITNYALPWGGSPENAFLLAGPGLSLPLIRNTERTSALDGPTCRMRIPMIIPRGTGVVSS